MPSNRELLLNKKFSYFGNIDGYYVYKSDHQLLKLHNTQKEDLKETFLCISSDMKCTFVSVEKQPLKIYNRNDILKLIKKGLVR